MLQHSIQYKHNFWILLIAVMRVLLRLGGSCYQMLGAVLSSQGIVATPGMEIE